jgi:hypothetical protein
MEHSFDQEEDGVFPEKVSFFIMNFSPACHLASVIKFHDTESIKDVLWSSLIESFRQECEEDFSDSDFEESEEGSAIEFYDYDISYRLVIGKDFAVFVAEHILLFIDPEGDLRNFRAAVLSECILFSIQTDPTDQIWFLPSTEVLDLSSRLEPVQ